MPRPCVSDSILDAELGRFLLEKVILLVFVTDRGGTIVHTNLYAESLCGRPLAGCHLSEVIVDFSGNFSLDAALNESAPKMWGVTTASGLPQTFHFRFLDQGSRLVAVGEYNYRDSSLLEARLIQLSQEVSNTNRELQKKTAELRRLDEMKNRWIGIAAHDLRGPIGAIHSFSEELCQDATTVRSPDESEILSAIRDSSGFMLALIDDLLGVATLESSEMRLNRELSDLNQIVAACVKLNRPLADRKAIGLEVQHDATFTAVALDRMKIQQVINNLISNAVKFSHPDSTVVITVAAEGTNALLSVEDHGQGIPAAELGLLFKPFSRSSVRPTAGESGTGLGLFIVKQIVEAHSGTIWVDTEVGTGTTFRLSLPLLDNPTNTGAES